MRTNASSAASLSDLFATLWQITETKRFAPSDHRTRPTTADQMYTVLAVDDDRGSRAMLESVLGAHGYNVVSVASGAEALTLMARMRPSVVVTDIMMPIMDGLTFCRTLRASRKTAQIPVVALTATEAVFRGVKTPFDIVLPKPLDVLRLVAAIERLLKKRPRRK